VSRKRVGILISGRGSNMSALIAAAKAPDYPAEIVGVLSNRAAAPGLEIAASHGIATASLAQSRFLSRDMFEDVMTQMLERTLFASPASCASWAMISSTTGPAG